MEGGTDHFDPHRTWHGGNQRVLQAAFAQAIAALERAADHPAVNWRQDSHDLIQDMTAPPMLMQIAALFDVDAAALDCLLLAALADQHPDLAGPLEAHPLSRAGYATPALLAAVRPDDDIAAILSPMGALRRNRLIDIDPNGRRYEQRIQVAPTVVDALEGRFGLTAPCATLLHPAQADPLAAPADPALAQRFGRAIAMAAHLGDGHLGRLFQMPRRLQATLLTAIAALGRPVLSGSAALLCQAIQVQPEVLGELQRDLRLCGAVIMLECGQEGPQGAAIDIARQLRGPIVMMCDEGAYRAQPGEKSAVLMLSDPAGVSAAKTPKDRLALWQGLLGAAHAPDELASLEHVAQTFALTPAEIETAAQSLQLGLAPDLWTAARQEAGAALDGLAERIDPLSHWDDLVLAPAQEQALMQMAGFLANRQRINSDWGFAAKTPRGLGMAALFYGDSGTGKTSAAEALIQRMNATGGQEVPLFRVNTSALVSKYIGETSKNFRRIFEAGAACGAALLWDEAEGLFGRRTAQSRDSNDKHANAEAGFLLQSLENYPGIAILTTNMRQSIDGAFLRRFRFAIEFPFPDEQMRQQIWQRVLPPALPVGTIDFARLAQLPLAGGHIRSVALNAAYITAAEGDAAVEMHHIAQAARLEFSKLEKAAPERLLAGFGDVEATPGGQRC